MTRTQATAYRKLTPLLKNCSFTSFWVPGHVFCHTPPVLNLPVGPTVPQIHSTSETKKLPLLHCFPPMDCALWLCLCSRLHMACFPLHTLPLKILGFCLVPAGLVTWWALDAGPLPWAQYLRGHKIKEEMNGPRQVVHNITRNLWGDKRQVWWPEDAYLAFLAGCI